MLDGDKDVGVLCKASGDAVKVARGDKANLSGVETSVVSITNEVGLLKIRRFGAAPNWKLLVLLLFVIKLMTGVDGGANWNGVPRGREDCGGLFLFLEIGMAKNVRAVEVKSV